MDTDTLAKLIKKKYPGKYDTWDDDALEKKIIETYPGKYDQYPRTTAPVAAPRLPVAGRGTRYGQPGIGPTNGEDAGRVWPLSPVRAISKVGQQLANKVEGVDRQITEPASFNVRGNLLAAKGSRTPTLDTVENVGWLGAGLTGVPSIYEAMAATPDAAKAVYEHPVEALRGGAAGVVEGIGNTTPMDALMLFLGQRFRGRAKSSPLSPAERVASPPGSSAIRMTKPSGEVVRSVPARPTATGARPNTSLTTADALESMQPDAGGKLGQPEITPDRLARAVRAMTEEARKAGETRQAPVTHPAPVPNEQGLIRGDDGVWRPAPGARYSISAPKTPKGPMEGDTDLSGAPRVPPKSKLPVKPRPAKPEAKISDLTENSTIKEVSEAVNALAKKEPEVLAQRNPDLEALAAEMESKPTAPNRKVSEAVVGESVRGASGKVQRVEPVLPAEMHTTVEGANGAKKQAKTPADTAMPADTVRRRATDFSPEAQRERMLELAKDPDAVKGANNLMRRKSDIDANRKLSPPRNAHEQAATTFEESAKAHQEAVSAAKTSPAEAAPQTIRKPVIKVVTELDGFNRVTIDGVDQSPFFGPGGPSDMAIRQLHSAVRDPEPFRRLEELKRQQQEPTPGMKNVTPKPVDTRPMSEINAGKTVAPLPKMTKPKMAAPVGEVPVTKVAPAETRPVANVSRDISALSPSEQVKLTSLERQMPQSVKAAVEAGGKLPKVSTELTPRVAEYRNLVAKAKGQGPVESRGLAQAHTGPPPATLDPGSSFSEKGWLTHNGQRLTVEDVTRLHTEAGAKIPPQLKKAIDSGSEWPKMTKEEWTPVADDVMAYNSWRERLREVENIRNRSAAIDKAAGQPIVEKSAAMAKKVELPKPATMPEPSAKVIDRAVEDALAQNATGKGKVQVRPYLTDKDIGPAPKGVDKKVWRTVNAIEREGARLYKERGWIDPRIVDRMRRFWGSEEAARRLGMKSDLVTEISGKPHKQKPLNQVLRELDEDLTRRYEFMRDDPRGFMRIEAMLAGAGVVAGGMVGAAIGGESIEDRAAAAVSLALVGAIAGVGAGRVGKSVNTVRKAGKIKAAVEELDTANLLMGPAMVKASFGSTGGIASAIWQRYSEGRVTDAKRMAKFAITEAPGMWLNTLKDQLIHGRPRQGNGIMGQRAAKQAGGVSSAVLNRVLAPFHAADQVGRTALKRGGFSDAEALRTMLNGEPTSWQGQTAMKLINSLWITRMLMKFPGVRIGALERAVEYTPGLSKRYASGPGSQGAHGTGRFHTRSAHGAEQLPESSRRARAQFGGAVILAGSAYGYLRDPNNAEASVAAAMAGPAALPAAAAIAAGRGLRRGGAGRAIMDAALEWGAAAPSITDTNIRSTVGGLPDRVPDRFKPLRPLRRGLGID